MTPPCEGERWWSVISVKLEVSYTFSIYFWLFIKARLGQVVILWPLFCRPPSQRNSPLSHFCLLLSLNQSSRLALLSDRGRTLSRPWWRLREMYVSLLVNITSQHYVGLSSPHVEDTEGGEELVEHDHLQRLPYSWMWSKFFWVWNVYSYLANLTVHERSLY